MPAALPLTNSQSPNPTSTTETNQFLTQTVAIVITAVAVLFAMFVLAFKKGYIKVEVVDEEDGETVDGENEGSGESGSEKVVKNGKVKGTQVYKCKECGHRFFQNGSFSKMRSEKNFIVAALNFYYDGLSLRKAQHNLEQIFGEHISQVTILNWIEILTTRKRIRHNTSSSTLRIMA